MKEIISDNTIIGKLQVFSLLFCGSLTVITSFSFYSSVFITAEPELHCINLPKSTYNSLDTCAKWTNLNLALTSNVTNYNCYFDTTYFGTTIVTDWGLYCDKQNLAALTQSFYIFGTMLSFLSGLISDVIGRKKIVVILCFTFVISSFTSNLINSSYFSITLVASNKYVLYNIYQLLAGFLSSSIYNCAYTLMIELITDKYHTTFSNIYCVIYIFGEVFTMGIYYFTRNWIATSWCITAYALISFIPFLIYVPESPRWLISQRRLNEAKKISKEIRHSNEKKEYANPETTKLTEPGSTPFIKKQKKSQFSSIINNFFIPSYNLFKILALVITYNAVCLNYVGISYGITTLVQLNPYSSFILSSVFEFIGTVLCQFNDLVGRKKALLVQIFLMSVSLLLNGILPDESYGTTLVIPKIILFLIAKLMVAAAFNTLIVFCAELYEVQVRNTAITINGSLGFLGSLLAPQINQLRVLVWQPLPYIIYATAGFVSCSILIFLPETYKNRSEK